MFESRLYFDVSSTWIFEPPLQTEAIENIDKPMSWLPSSLAQIQAWNFSDSKAQASILDIISMGRQNRRISQTIWRNTRACVFSIMNFISGLRISIHIFLRSSPTSCVYFLSFLYSLVKKNANNINTNSS